MTDVLADPVNPDAADRRATVTIGMNPESGRGDPTGPGALRLLVAALALPLALFVVLQPETFGLSPNALDPIFYSGLGVNFDDASRIGDQHYFITRWSSWYPLYLADLVAGPIWGRLLVRLGLVALLLYGLWRLRPTWNWIQRLAAGTVLVTSPIFLRALLTDYVEWTVLIAGSALVLLALRPDIDRWTAPTAGALTGLLVVANPFASLAAAPPLAVLLLRRRGPGAKAALSATVAFAALAVLGLGAAWFRVVHGIDDLYGPTIRFLADPPADGLRSPRLDWLTHFTWLFLPFLVAATSIVTSLSSARPADRVERTAVAMAVGQTALHWLDQFGRGGSGLELSYYWSMSFTTTGIALALVVGRLAATVGLRSAGAVAGLWLGLLLAGVPDWARLPPGAVFGLISVVTVAAVAAAIRYLPAVVALGLFGFYGLWLQIGAPVYDPTAYHAYNVSPRYDRLFRGDGDGAEQLYRETIWVTEVLDQLPGDDAAMFLPVGPGADTIAGVYHAHVNHQLLRVDPVTGYLPPATEFKLVASDRPWLVVVGTLEAVQDQLDTTLDQLGFPPPELDQIHEEGRVRLVVLDLDRRPVLPFTFEGTDLPTQVGSVDGNGISAPRGTPAGFASFGPYLTLPPGSYVAQLSYRAAAPVGTEAGTFDINSRDGGQQVVATLTGTGGATATLELPFSVDAHGDLWEFRTFTNGSADLVIEDITLDWG